jgi:hypothetical protein
MLNGIIFKSEHIFSLDNKIADAISRKQWYRFKKLDPAANDSPDHVPVDYEDSSE